MKKLLLLGTIALSAGASLEAMNIMNIWGTYRVKGNLKNSVLKGPLATTNALSHLGYDKAKRRFNKQPSSDLSLTLEKCRKKVAREMASTTTKAHLWRGLAGAGLSGLMLSRYDDPLFLSFSILPLIGVLYEWHQGKPSNVALLHKKHLQTVRILAHAEKAAQKYEKPTKETL